MSNYVQKTVTIRKDQNDWLKRGGADLCLSKILQKKLDEERKLKGGD